MKQFRTWPAKDFSLWRCNIAVNLEQLKHWTTSVAHCDSLWIPSFL